MNLNSSMNLSLGSVGLSWRSTLSTFLTKSSSPCAGLLGRNIASLVKTRFLLLHSRQSRLHLLDSTLVRAPSANPKCDEDQLAEAIYLSE